MRSGVSAGLRCRVREQPQCCARMLCVLHNGACRWALPACRVARLPRSAAAATPCRLLPGLRAVQQKQAALAAAGGAPSASTATSGPAAKRAKVEPAGAAAGAAPRPAAAMPGMPTLQQQQAMMAAMMAGRPPLPPGMGMGGVPLTAVQQAALAQARLQQSLTAKSQFPPIVRPAGEEDRQFVPRQRLQVRAGGATGLGLGWQCVA